MAGQRGRVKESDDSGPLVGRRRDGPVLIISMERAAKRNAIDRAMADALDEPSTSWTMTISCGRGS